MLRETLNELQVSPQIEIVEKVFPLLSVVVG